MPQAPGANFDPSWSGMALSVDRNKERQLAFPVTEAH
jgi:hypothetical protein